MWNQILAVAAAASAFIAMAWVFYELDKDWRAGEKARRKLYEYATSDQAIKDAAKRHAKFLKHVQEEMREEAEKVSTA